MKTALEFLHSLDGVVAIDASVAIIAARDAEWQARVEAAEAAERLAVMTLAGGPSEATLAKARAEGNAEGIKLGRRMGLAIAGWSNDEIEALIAKTEAGT